MPGGNPRTMKIPSRSSLSHQTGGSNFGYFLLILYQDWGQRSKQKSERKNLPLSTTQGHRRFNGLIIGHGLIHGGLHLPSFAPVGRQTNIYINLMEEASGEVIQKGEG